jgi:quercetin dioxygenase-like cupin family protein
MRLRTSPGSPSRSTAGCILSDAFIHGASVPWTELDPGVRRKMLGHGSDLMMVSVEFEQGARGSMHSHPHRQVTYVARGSFNVTIAERTDLLRAGDSFFVAADLVHGVEALEPGTLIDVFTPARAEFLGTPPPG